MKKAIPFLFVLIALSCNKDSDIPNVETPVDENLMKQNVLLSVNIDSDNYYRNDESFSTSGYIYLTNSKGELIDSALLSNNSKTTIESDFDIENESYSATFVSKQLIKDIGVKHYYLNTFVDIDPYEIQIDQSVSNDLNFNEKHAKIVLTNVVNGAFELISSSAPRLAFSTEIDDLFELSIWTGDNPINVYTTFKNSAEPFYRYLWLENINNETEKIIEYKDIPIIADSIVFDHPQNERLKIDLFGSKMPNINRYHGIFHNHGFNNVANLPVIYYPDMLFDNYQLNFSLEIDEVSYFKSKKTNTLTNDFELPDLDFEVVNNSLANYEMKSSSEFDFYNVELRYVLQSVDYRIFWQIYGKSSKVMNFVLPNIKAMVFDDISNFSLDSLKQSSKIYNYEGLDNYEDFIHTRFNNKSEKQNKVTLWEFVRK